MEKNFDETEQELRTQAAGQLRASGAAWEFERRQGIVVDELIAAATAIGEAPIPRPYLASPRLCGAALPGSPLGPPFGRRRLVSGWTGGLGRRGMSDGPAGPGPGGGGARRTIRGRVAGAGAPG